MQRSAALTLMVMAVCVAVAAPAQEESTPPPFKPEELEQIVAPIALYPDSLLAQIFMASTYPLEVVEAERWQKANPKVTGEALETAMQQQSWDPSVKSLTAFPQVLTMMSEKLDWTQKLGDAFLAQQKDVMDAVQRLRARAQENGTLKDTEEQKVVVQQVPAPAPAAGAPPQTESQTTVIQIEPADPQVVYVPQYNPTTVYGGWPYPAYPPYAYYPPGYVATSLLTFGAGMAVGAALWGDCDWGHGDVDVDINNYNNFNKTDIKNNKWQHNAEHRKGVNYRDQATRDKYGRGQAQNAKTRDQFRGRAEQGRRDLPKNSDLARGGANQGRGGGQQRPSTQPRASGGQPRAADRAASGSRERASTEGRHEGMGQGRTPNAFKDMGNSAATRQASDRGRSSRQSAQQFGGGGRGGGSRGGGGFSGGGGGGRGGGGRGGGRR